jgi:hypothetical protein
MIHLAVTTFTAFYDVGLFLLTAHLSHGFASVVQTLGIK